MEYLVISVNDIETLETEVNILLDKGWKLQGGVSCALSESDDYRYERYAQALVYIRGDAGSGNS